MNEIHTALQREAALVAEEMCTGATLVSKTNYARKGRYLQLFFSLSIAFERAAKLIIVVDHIIETGQKSDETNYRNYKHDLNLLLAKVSEISNKLDVEYNKMPETQIHNNIVKILSNFASNVTRYYNLDIIAKGDNKKIEEPISQWYKKVTLPLFKKYVSKQKKDGICRDASLASLVMNESVIVSHTNEAGKPMNNIFDASYQTGMLKATTPYIRLYILQICRFLSSVLSELGRISFKKSNEDIPYMSDFFRVFNNKDSYFKKRKTWEIV